MSQLPLTIAVAAIPAGRYSPQELAELIAERLTISSDVAFALFRKGTTVPTSDEGLFYNDIENIWMRWDETIGTYVEVSASDETLGYILSASEPDPDIFKVWVVLDVDGDSTDIRTYSDGAWRSFLKGTANGPLVYNTTGQGVSAVDPANTGAVLTSNGASAAPTFKYIGADIGDIKWTGRTTPRAGWLTCDGSAIDRTAYALLFAEIGTTYGAGNGSTTFNTPNMPGRVVVTAGAGSGLTARTIAQTGGEETHALTEAELAAHNHVISGLKYDAFNAATQVKVTGWALDGEAAEGSSGAFGTVNGGSANNKDTEDAGSGTAHNNLQPFIVLNAFIYAGA